MSVDRALAGIEEELLVGYTLTFPTDMFVDERVDYVALGHIHKYQVIRKKEPAIVYAGSLERVDFGEEKEDKGFVHVRLARKSTTFEFKSISPRPFITVDVDVADSAVFSDPTDAIVDRLSKFALKGCVLRVRYRIGHDRVNEVNEAEILRAARDCLTVRVQPEVVPAESRGRLPDLTESSVTSPMKALSTYLDEVAPDRKERLMARAQEVMSQVNAEFEQD
jgi:exonuclease SbcD